MRARFVTVRCLRFLSPERVSSTVPRTEEIQAWVVPREQDRHRIIVPGITVEPQWAGCRIRLGHRDGSDEFRCEFTEENDCPRTV